MPRRKNDPIIARFQALMDEDAPVPTKRVAAARNSVTPPEKAVVSWDAKPRIYPLDGVPTEFFSIGDLADAVGVRPVTLRSWEAKGILPAPTFRTPPPKGGSLPDKAVRGQRLYLREQVDLVVAAVRQFNILTRSPRWVDFTAHVQRGWRVN